MADIFSKQKRSAIMSHIKSTQTNPEKRLGLILREILGKNIFVRRNDTNLPGSPDFAIYELKLAIFVDGCFFHECPIHGHIPKTNKAYWNKKFLRNRKYASSANYHLRKLGFSVWRIWSHRLNGNICKTTTSLLKKRFDKIHLKRKNK